MTFKNARNLTTDDDQQDLPFDDSVDAIFRPRWIEYDVAKEALTLMQQIMDHPPSHRPPCCLLVGDTNNGKTTIALQFSKVENRSYYEENNEERHPVVYLQAPPGPDLSQLYSGILRSLDAPFPKSSRWPAKQDQLLTLLPRFGVRMIIIDEIHNLIQGNRDQQQLFLNGLKFLTNELRIPIVALGTRNAESIFQTDQQMGNRFEPFRIPRWEPNEKYAIFVNRVIHSTGFEASKDFTNKRLINKIHVETNGLTGETTKLLHATIAIAADQGERIVSPSHLEEVRWVKPDERRRQAR